MRLSLDKVTGSFKPKTSIKHISTELGPLSDLSDIFDPAYLVFDFTTPGLNKEDLEYSFLLEGHDKEWTQWSKQYLKEYNSLSNGNYTFHVKARVIGTIHESETSSVSFHISIPWYKLSSSYIIAGALLIIIVVILLRIRAGELNNAKIELERVVAERTKELVDEREKLKALNDELIIANTELDNFVYRSSHDLVAPLKSLRGLMVVTRLDTQDPKMLEYVSMMESSALKLEKFINSIMEYSINAKSANDTKAIDLNKILDEIEEEIKFFDKYSAIDFSREIDSAEFNSDPKRIKIVMSNLITNAIKYHNLNQENPRIKIKSYTDDNSYYIDVEDNGLGISEDLIDKIFDMFYRASATSEGSGLGLYIVKDTMKKLDGQW
jgi:signal transduction histidine kinase